VKQFTKNISIVLIALFLLLSGYLRDFIFKKINALLQAWDHNMDYDMPSPMAFLANWQYDSVLSLKWLLTFVFWGIYLFISLITVKLFFRRNLYIKITLGVFVGVLLISGIFMGLGFLIKPISEKMYEFTRYLMGIAQSPIIIMILLPVFKLYNNEKPEIIHKHQSGL
jgi:hypothetical protein